LLYLQPHFLPAWQSFRCAYPRALISSIEASSIALCGCVFCRIFIPKKGRDQVSVAAFLKASNPLYYAQHFCWFNTQA